MPGTGEPTDVAITCPIVFQPYFSPKRVLVVARETEVQATAAGAQEGGINWFWYTYTDS